MPHRSPIQGHMNVGKLKTCPMAKEPSALRRLADNRLNFQNRALRVFRVVLLIVTLPACHGEFRTADTPPTNKIGNPAKPDGSQHAVSIADLPAVVPGTHVTSADIAAHQDGWETEVFAQRSLGQLKILGQRLADPSSIHPAAFADLSADDASYTSFCPETLDEAFRDATLVVERMPSSSEAASAFRGPEGLAQALLKLLESLRAPRGIRSKFKVMHVDKKASPPTTRVLVQLSGQTDLERFSVNAIWNVGWLPTESQAAPQIQRIELESYQQVTASSAQPLFADCTASVLEKNESFHRQLLPGTDHWTGALDMRLGIYPGGEQGLVTADVNGDGLDDLYICQPGGLPNRLYVQNVDGTATDRSAASGVDWLETTHDALLLDLDNDGDQDLVVGVHEGVLVHANDGTGKFELKLAKLLPAAIPFSLVAADYDQDGLLDIYICCYYRRVGDRRRVFARAVPYHDANNGGRNVLLHNEGNLRFRQATKRVGFDENNRRFSYAAAWGDFDNDGDQDLYVANDFGRNNLYQNDGGVFRDVAANAGVEDIGAGMSACWGDYDNDGQLDLYVGNMFSSAGSRISIQERFHGGANESDLAGLRRHARGNALFRNLGNGRFEDVSVSAGVVMGRWAWSTKFVDVNLDGWEDLLVANGFITQEDTNDL